MQELPFRAVEGAGPPCIPHPSFLGPWMAMIAALGLSTAAWCQEMNDPTRPPAAFAGADADAAAAGGPVLQSVLIAPSGSSAIISGEMVRLGQKYGDAVLVKVSESEVVLRNESGAQVLKLHPGIEKRMETAAPTTAPRRSRGSPRAAPAPAGQPALR